MTHVFLLILVMNGQTISKDMYFADIQRCNWFASQLTKRYGNYSYRDLVPQELRATAYCRPVYVDTSNEGIQIY